MIGVTLYKNNKKVNSTALPTAQVGTLGLSCELKDVTNLFNPILVFSVDIFTDSQGNLKNPLDYNYCSIPDFNRYYFIRSWSWVLGRWEAALEIDVLASHRADIGAATAYVLRSASACDPDVIDTKYPTLSGMERSSTVKNSRWDTNINSTAITQGFYVIGVVNNDANAVGVTSYYVLSGAGMREFIQKLYASPSWMNITDTTISNDLQKMLMNPIQYITSCMWFPFGVDPSTLAQRGGTIPVGWWSISMTNTVYWLEGATMRQTQYETFDIPVHPQASANANLRWLRNAPYSQYQLQLYPYGVMPLDSAKLIGYNRLFCRMDIDLMTGSSVLSITRGIDNTQYSDTVIYSAVGQVGIPISLAQMSVDMSRLTDGTTWVLSAGMALANNKPLMSDLAAAADAAGGIVDAAASIGGITDVVPAMRAAGHALGETAGAMAAAGKTLLQTAGQTLADTGNAVLSSSGVCKTQGSNGSLAQFELQHILTCYYFRISPVDPDHYGWPLCQKRKINTLSGFVLCANEGDFVSACTPAERQAIIGAMLGGFYYE
jgi:hypothetical protein